MTNRDDAAVLRQAQVTVDQWDKYDKFRDPLIGESDSVAIARLCLKKHSDIEYRQNEKFFDDRW